MSDTDKPLLALRHIDSELTDEARAIMLDLILSWAKFESALSQFLLLAFGTSLDEGSLLVGNMQTRDKLEKLKALYQHHGMTWAAQSINNLISLHKHFVDVRNAIAHHACLGMYVPAAEGAVMFSAGKIAKGNKGLIAGAAYSLEHMILAEAFATKATNLLAAVTKRRRRPSRPPLAPPLFRILPDPSPPEMVEVM